MSWPDANGEADVSEIALGKFAAGRMTSGTGFESAGGVPGFSTSTDSAPAVATSAGCSVTVQRLGAGQFVERGELSMSNCDAPLLVLARKLRPCTASRKLFCGPATMLDGRMASITGAEVSATVAVAASDGFAVLIAVIAMAFGDGATAGAM